MPAAVESSVSMSLIILAESVNRSESISFLDGHLATHRFKIAPISDVEKNDRGALI